MHGVGRRKLVSAVVVAAAAAAVRLRLRLELYFGLQRPLQAILQLRGKLPEHALHLADLLLPRVETADVQVVCLTHSNARPPLREDSQEQQLLQGIARSSEGGPSCGSVPAGEAQEVASCSLKHRRRLALVPLLRTEVLPTSEAFGHQAVVVEHLQSVDEALSVRPTPRQQHLQSSPCTLNNFLSLSLAAKLCKLTAPSLTHNGQQRSRCAL
mmetsp:Transcript_59807/g.169475  ORF Transcript_59807/g.169475 Transcript_59807/m.169475 type:complete len:212 (-) Transcript_59807:220-855(-)